MLRLYFVRHGETKWNVAGIYQGHKDSELTELGVSQAYKLADAIEDIKFDAIYSSTLGRAIQTATILKKDRDLTIKTIDDIREMHFGKLEGMVGTEVDKVYGHQRKTLRNNPENYDPSEFEGETFDELSQRCDRFLNYLLKNYHNGNILIVSHGITLKTLFALIEDQPIKHIWDRERIKNTSLSMVEFDNDNFDVKLFSDTAHLE